MGNFPAIEGSNRKLLVCNRVKISDKESSSLFNNQVQESDRRKFE